MLTQTLGIDSGTRDPHQAGIHSIFLFLGAALAEPEITPFHCHPSLSLFASLFSLPGELGGW